MIRRMAFLIFASAACVASQASAQYDDDRLKHCNAYCRSWMGWDDDEVIYLAPRRRERVVIVEEVEPLYDPAPRRRVVERPRPPRPDMRKAKSEPVKRAAEKPRTAPVRTAKAHVPRAAAPAPQLATAPRPPERPALAAAEAPASPRVIETAPTPPIAAPAPVIAAPDVAPVVETTPPPVETDRFETASLPPTGAREPDSLPTGDIRKALGLASSRAFETELSVGDVLDPSIELQPLPASFKKMRPYFSELLFTVIGDTAYLVYPETRRIVMAY